jgi:hypothetical protein
MVSLSPDHQNVDMLGPFLDFGLILRLPQIFGIYLALSPGFRALKLPVNEPAILWR